MSLAAAAVESLPPSSVPSLLTLSTGGGRKRKQHPSPPFPREEEISRGRELAPTPTDGRADGWKGGPRCFLSHIRTGPPSASSLFNEHRLKAPPSPPGWKGGTTGPLTIYRASPVLPPPRWPRRRPDWSRPHLARFTGFCRPRSE